MKEGEETREREGVVCRLDLTAQAHTACVRLGEYGVEENDNVFTVLDVAKREAGGLDVLQCVFHGFAKLFAQGVQGAGQAYEPNLGMKNRQQVTTLLPC